MNERGVGEILDHLYRQHRRELLGYAMREGANAHDAEDIVQTTFLNAHRAILAGNEPRQVRPWLYAIVRNVARRFVNGRISVEPLVEELEPIEDDRSTALGELAEAIVRLPLNQREALLLRAIGGHNYSEIGRRLDISVGAVQMLLFRARKTLQRQLEEGRRGLAGLVPLLLRPVTQIDATGFLVGAAVIGVAVANVGGAAPASREASGPIRPASATFLTAKFALPPTPARIVAPLTLSLSEPRIFGHVQQVQAGKVDHAAPPARVPAPVDRPAPPRVEALPPQLDPPPPADSQPESPGPTRGTAPAAAAPQPVIPSPPPVSVTTPSLELPQLPVPAPQPLVSAVVSTVADAATDAETTAAPPPVAVPALSPSSLPHAAPAS